jgi:hypothetical protein
MQAAVLENAGLAVAVAKDRERAPEDLQRERPAPAEIAAPAQAVPVLQQAIVGERGAQKYSFASRSGSSGNGSGARKTPM